MKLSTRAILLAALLLILPLIVHAQDETPEPEVAEIDYFNSTNTDRRFNVPIPPGWENRSSSERAFFANPAVNGEIYTLAVDGVDAAAGIVTALSEIIPDMPTQPMLRAEISLRDGLWIEYLYTLDAGVDVSAFGHVRGDATYVMIYIDRNPDTAFHMLILQSNEESESISTVLDSFVPGLSSTPETTSEMTIGSGVWTRSTYTLDNGPVITLSQQPSETTYTYLVIEQNPMGLVDSLNATFFIVFRGFFLTPTTDPYLVLGLTATAVLMLTLTASFVVRYRGLKKDEALIEQIKRDMD